MSKTINKKGILMPPAIGYSFMIVLDLIKNNKIQVRYFPKLFAIIIVNLINLPFRSFERKFINPRFKNKPIEKAPIFILGHWRSGTTHLHNLLCLDKNMAYTTTYQSVFPDTLFNKLGRFLFLGFSSLLIPGTRKGDNVKLGSSLPQEEEFALGDKVPFSFYFFWMFPKNMLEYYHRFIRFEKIDKNQLELWKQYYKLLIKKAIKNTRGNRFLSKNPPNTGRIKVLLEMFPDAKFIHIHRNPIEVFLSTQNFYNKMMPPLQLQNIDSEEVTIQIQEVYKKLMKDYFKQKEMIPSKNLVEISFEDLEAKPLETLKKIYSELNIEGFNLAEPDFVKYVSSKKSYKKNKHTIKKQQLNILLCEWGFAMEKLKYLTPSTIHVLD